MQIQKFNWIIRRAGLYNAGPGYKLNHRFGFSQKVTQ